jgi:hypothetical protein
VQFSCETPAAGLGIGTKLAKSGLILYWRQQTVAPPANHAQMRKTQKRKLASDDILVDFRAFHD